MDRPSWSEWLETFLACYVPKRSGETEELLHKCRVHEDALFYWLEAKYGPDPVPLTQRNDARIAAFFVRAGLPVPEEAEIDEIIRALRGGEEDFFFHLQQQYGAEHPL
ncbi:hypothetical protein DQ04_00711120 [Trypanosoma grayi]|uniref:hypothetical protein n=1 Tax=Trypanosoma grayi TaxID=71804 RepID=UPI0004F42F5A|nr:hypothetical protein DQ04_00711120 [Trypanosoma grayi]KEG13934.1 hypothetical protein DQ04_00711120 [Trypanosoma grayi]